jgi:ATP-binding cassette subfamily C (CFTR/MRP) protein 4
MLQAVVNSPLSFFDSNPAGRIVNRFSLDVNAADDLLPAVVVDFVTCSVICLGAMLIVCVINPYVIIPVAPLLIVFYFTRRLFTSSSREIKRIEAMSRSPVQV